MVTRAVEDYLKAIYKLQQDGSPATTNAIAEHMGLRAASVTAMLQQLSRQGLADYRSHRGAYLTEEGITAALRVIRRHRLIELYLNQKLGVPWDRIHDEAERLEHAISPYLEERIDAALGHPSFDPHGAPIPSSTGALPERDLMPLSELPLNTPAVVRHIPDDDPELLRHMASLGIVPDVTVTVIERYATQEGTRIMVGPLTGDIAQNTRYMSQEAAQKVFVERPMKYQAAFLWDGTLLDIYVLNTTLSDWQATVDWLRNSPYSVTFLLNDQVLPVPEDVSAYFANSSQVGAHMHIRMGNILISCRFFDEEEIDFNIEPREIDSDDKVDSIVEFMKQLGNLLGKDIILTPEDSPGAVLLHWSPDSREITYDPTYSPIQLGPGIPVSREEMEVIFKEAMLRREQYPPDVTVREAKPDDAESIASVLHEAFVEYQPLYTPEAFAATTPPSDQIQTRMNEGPVWVALRDDAIVGTVSAVPKGEALYVRGMGILPSARGQGIGELLLRDVETFASRHGYKRLFLSTTPFLTRAIRLYEHFGFQHSSEGPHDLFGTPLFTMSKALG